MITLLVDILAVLIFVIIGRDNHGEENTLLGILGTSAPFLIALAVAWLALRLLKIRRRLTTALFVWAVTVGGGLTLRNVAFGDGTAFSFIVVTTITLGVLIVGLRLLAGRFLTRR
jgi:hypothetical protein